MLESLRSSCKVPSGQGPRGGMVDAADLKSVVRKDVPVRVRSGVLRNIPVVPSGWRARFQRAFAVFSSAFKSAGITAFDLYLRQATYPA